MTLLYSTRAYQQACLCLARWEQPGNLWWKSKFLLAGTAAPPGQARGAPTPAISVGDELRIEKARILFMMSRAVRFDRSSKQAWSVFCSKTIISFCSCSLCFLLHVGVAQVWLVFFPGHQAVEGVIEPCGAGLHWHHGLLQWFYKKTVH